jgi:hypothetical protein
MRDFFAFRKMIAPFVVQIIFVIGLVGVVGVGIAAFANDQPLAGVLILVFGGLYWRILCEVFIVLFRMNNTLSAINVNIAAISATGRGPTAPAPIADAPKAVERGESREQPEAPVAAPTPAPDLPPTGWYDDPERPGHKRWWDGTAWGMRDDEHSGAR